MPFMQRLPGVIIVIILSAASAAAAQQQGQPDVRATEPRVGGLPAIDGPPAPMPPEVLTRDDAGRATMRAVRLSQPLKVDGRLDDEIYGTLQSASDFIQQEPREGELATERTEIWVLFDDKNLYVSARCFDSHPERDVVNELRRDGQNMVNNENFTVVLDTFYDRRNGLYFGTNPLGAMRDQTVTDNSYANPDWNTVWDVKTGRFDKGWTVEMVIPFKSLRYNGAGPQVWGLVVRRGVRWKNEPSYLTHVPAAYGISGTHHLNIGATLVGLETPGQSMNLELKPYAVSSLTTDRTASAPFNNRSTGDWGFDFKYGLTRSLIADATYNTDFAQVEEDVQQINLTRFSLFFPEKREFFLEGQGIFGFGGASLSSGGGGNTSVSSAEPPILFFSRRIGFNQGQSVPVEAGGRVTGKAGKFGIGALNIQTDEKASAGAVGTNFAVLRVKRDVLRRSSIGILATRRTPNVIDEGANMAVGIDANMLFFKNVTINSYYSRTDSPQTVGDPSSYRGRFDYAGDCYGFGVEHLLVGEGFNPEVGCARRTDFRRSSINARFSPRPKSSRVVRKLNWEGSYDYVTDGKHTSVENREAQGTFRIEFQNSDQWNTNLTRDFEYLPAPFTIAPRVTLPVGGYDYQSLRTSYSLGQQRRVSGRMAFGVGSFYGGDRKEASFSSGRVKLWSRLNVEPSITLNWIDLPQGDFTTRLFTSRIILTPTPRMLISSLLQYNAVARTMNSSVRLRWEYTSGSELFVVYSDGRDTSVPRLLNRSVAIKLTRLLRF